MFISVWRTIAWKHIFSPHLDIPCCFQQNLVTDMQLIASKCANVISKNHVTKHVCEQREHANVCCSKNMSHHKNNFVNCASLLQFWKRFVADVAWIAGALKPCQLSTIHIVYSICCISGKWHQSTSSKIVLDHFVLQFAVHFAWVVRWPWRGLVSQLLQKTAAKMLGNCWNDRTLYTIVWLDWLDWLLKHDNKHCSDWLILWHDWRQETMTWVRRAL